ncbi:hypothetical protein [Saccharopolyspora sp. NPDC050642]|uniref:hypothetical protein n=1 Tax=Saccharopolyspora sp. NPDC050642 TaxID=3157099 RepID=UPI0034064DEF
MFEEHLDVAESSDAEQFEEHRQAVAPRADFAVVGLQVVLPTDRGGELLQQPALLGLLEQVGSAAANVPQTIPQQDHPIVTICEGDLNALR